MPRKFYADAPEGARIIPDVTHLTHYVQGCAFKFAIHPSLHLIGCLTVSHWDSGKKVADIMPDQLGAALGDKKAAGAATITRLAEKVGESRLRSALAGAAPIRKPE